MTLVRIAGSQVTVGHTSLGGWWLVLYLALMLGYFFVLEVTTGQSAGKALAGLRVLGPDASRPSAGAIAGRTVLRLIDWLPGFYLVGFISMLATGQRRRRLGDLAAGTDVVQLRPAPRGGLAAVLTMATLVVIGLCTLSLSVPGTYEGHYVAFRYPTSWQAGSVRVTARAGSQDKLWDVEVSPGTAGTVIIAAYGLNFTITQGNLAANIPALQNLTASLYQNAGGALRGGPDRITVGGLPAVRFLGTLLIAGRRFEDTVTYAFKDSTEYLINCEQTAAGAAQMERGCAQVVNTFQAG